MLICDLTFNSISTENRTALESTEVNTLYLLSTKPIIQHCFLPGSRKKQFSFSCI